MQISPKLRTYQLFKKTHEFDFLIFFLISFFTNYNVQGEIWDFFLGGGGGGGEYEKKELQSALFRTLGQWTGNNFLFEGGLVPTLRNRMW